MTPELKGAIQGVINAYYMEAKKNYNSFTKKPRDHVYKDLVFLKEQVKVNRKRFQPKLYCAGDHEIHSLLNTMMDLKDSLELTQEQIDWTIGLNDEVTLFCLNKKPIGKAQVEMKNESPHRQIEQNDAKEIILARMRNMLITQNI